MSNPAAMSLQDILDAHKVEQEQTADFRALARELLNQFGGVTGLAKEIWDRYENAQSEHTRAMLLKLTVDLLELAGPPDQNPLSERSAEELGAYLRHAVGGGAGA